MKGWAVISSGRAGRGRTPRGPARSGACRAHWPQGRCPLCGARTLARTQRRLVDTAGRPRRFAFACQTCGLLLDEVERAGEVRAALDAALRLDRFETSHEHPFGLDAYTLRSAASRLRRRIVPLGADQMRGLREPHGELGAHAGLVDLPATGVPVSLGILCRPADLADVAGGLSPHAAWTRDVAILLSEPADARVLFVEGFDHGSVCVAGRDLAENFGAQRNALQALSRTDWMLQLDADEALAPEAAAALPAFAAIAQGDGIVSLGLARRNLVDGVLSDVFPDIQYRLNHRSVSYAGRVHERPERPWQRSQILLHGAIEHRLSRAHVEARSTRYEAIEPGRGRLDERAALLVPYRD